MSSWRLFSDSGGNFGWEVYGECLEVKPEYEPPETSIQTRSSTHSLPSMLDLLIEGYSKLQDNYNEDRNTPIFRTGLGKSVEVKRSSIEKALSVLGEKDSAETVHYNEAQQLEEANERCISNSFFQTGSGKKVNVSSEGLIKAKALLGLEEDSDQFSHQSLQWGRKLYDSNNHYLEKGEGVSNMESVNDASLLKHPIVKTYSEGLKAENEVYPFLNECEIVNKALKPPPIKFHTAGGRSISVSSDALERAKNLLGDPEIGSLLDDEDLNDTMFTISEEKRVDNTTPNSGYCFQPPSFGKEMEKNKNTSTTFVSPYLSSALEPSFKGKNILGSNLIKKFDAVEHCTSNRNETHSKKPVRNMPNTSVDDSFGRGIKTSTQSREISWKGPLQDISNTIDTLCTDERTILSEKKRFLKGSSISPFKRPRSSKFSTPLKKNVHCFANGPSISSSDDTCSKRKLSTRYPHQASRMYVKEYFEMPLPKQCTKEMFSDEVKRIKADNAEKFMFEDKSGFKMIGIEAFSRMLNDSGASVKYASKMWVTNHYKWIVWKLACYERRHSTKFLTVSNVLEELKYRYEREVNHGHRSAIKRVLEGDASPSSLMVLCVSAIYSNYDAKLQNSSQALNGSESSAGAQVELTDGWYSVAAHLDGLLSKQLTAGKLFVGQKLRIWRAGLCGWVGPVSPLEVPDTVSLLLHINGTYRAHWADRLGFCKHHSGKDIDAPLSFRCIKSNGGPIPWTLVGVTRIYPILYKERSSDGCSIVRSERLESKMMQLHNHRRSVVVDCVSSEFQRAMKSPYLCNDNDSEGAKIFNILETSAEPEILMAEMSPEQLTSFANYQSKIEAIKHSDMEKKIMKALADAGLDERVVTPFMRVRVVGLMSRFSQRRGSCKEGLITIWNPSANQQYELIEGQAYAVSGLLPINCDSDILYLQAKGSTTKWQSLTSHAVATFEPFFSPRKSVLLSNLGEISLSSEFDIAAVIIYVGEVYTAGQEKKQWVFVTDGSISESHSEDLSTTLLAINFSSPYVDDETFAPINSNITGSTVAFCNLIKRAKDCVNHLWVAEATENSSYFLNLDTMCCSHLKNAAFSAQRWEKISSLTIEKLRNKISLIIGNSKG